MSTSGQTISGNSIGPHFDEPIVGIVSRLTEPLCFLAVDPEAGNIMDRFHPQHGRSIRDQILVMPGSRGGGATPDQLCETIRLDAGPKAIVLPLSDAAIAIGATVADRLYGKSVPIVVVDGDTYTRIADMTVLEIQP